MNREFVVFAANTDKTQKTVFALSKTFSEKRCVKLLGVLLNTGLTWEAHIHNCTCLGNRGKYDNFGDCFSWKF